MKTSKIFAFSLAFLSFLLPLFFLPLTVDFYIFNKLVLFYFFVSLLLVLWAVKAYFSQKIVFNKNALNLPVLGMVVAFLLSTFIQAPNKPMSLAFSSGLIFFAALLFFVIANQIKNKAQVKLILASLIASSVVLAWLSIFAYLGLTENIGPAWLKSKAWSPTGSSLTTLTFMLMLLPGTLYWAFKSKGSAEKILLFLASSLQILASILIVSLFVNKTIQFVYLPPKYGWQIAVEGFKTLKTAFFGVGPGNFLSAFLRFRPTALNNTNVWTVRFNSNSNQYFDLLSTVGLIGLGFWLLIALKTLKKENFKTNLINKVLLIMAATSFIVQLILPLNFLTLFATFLVLALSQVKERPAEEKITITNKYFIWAFSGIVAVFVLAVFYFEGRLWLADFYFRKSLLAAQQNKGLETYNLQIKALGLNPFSEDYHASYSQTNFALANSLASKKDLTDQDRKNISQLLSQAVREAKISTNLNPQLSIHWANLASIYRNMINVAQQADQWAIAAFLQAVRTDPTNPLLRVNFGGLFYALQNYDRAIEQFKLAVNLKPDYANAYYNLAAAYRAKKDWTQAYLNMQQAVALAPANSPDKDRVLKELEEIKAKLPKQPQQATPSAQLKKEERLIAPSPIPTPKPGFSNITLPEEAAPEIPANSPSPKPSPTQEGTSSAQPS